MSRTYRRTKGEQCHLIGVPGWVDETIEEYNSWWLRRFHWDRCKYFTRRCRIKEHIRDVGLRSVRHQECRRVMMSGEYDTYNPSREEWIYRSAAWVL